MTTLVFRTPGVLDLRALTTFGMSAKPNSTSPIGMFGTGLKYAVAVMVRMGAEPVLWRGTDKHVFYRKPVDFRGADFDLIGVRHERFATLANPREELPFTTQLGSTWEAWQAYRELEANTRDEGGKTYCLEADESVIGGEPGYTLIVVDHPAMLEAYAKRDEIFLRDGLLGLASDDTVELVSLTSSRYLYYRRLRVANLQKPALYTWNLISHQELTEDRTLKYEYLARTAVAEHISRSNNEDIIDAVLSASPSFWEHDLVFDYAGTPSDAFRAVMARRGGKVTESVARYYAPYVAEPESKDLGVFEKYPRPWVANDFHIADALGRRIVCAHDDVGDDDRGVLINELTRIVNEAER